MEKTANALSKLDNVCVIALTCVIVFPTLPLKFTLQQIGISLLGVISLIMAVYALSNLCRNGTADKNGIKNSRIDAIEWLLFAFLAYIVMQLIPLPRPVVDALSPSMAALWQVDAYGLNGKAVLTADISGTIWFLVTWCGYFFLFILLSRLISKEWHFVLIILTIYLIGLYQVLFDEVTKYLGYEYITAGQTDGHSYRLTGTFVNSNNLSALINLSIAAGFTLLVYLKFISFRLSTPVFIISLVFIGLGELALFYGLIKAGSAGGLLSLILSVFLVTLIVIMQRFSLRVLLGLALFIVIISLILVIYGSRELNVAQLRDNLSLSGRPLLWQSVIEMWKDFPLFGVGAGAFEWTFPMYKSDAVTPLRVFTAHSGYLHLAVETGFIGVLLGAMFAWAYFREILSIFKKNQFNRNITGSLMVGVFAFMIHECVETNLLIPPVAILFFSVLALSLTIDKLNFDTR